VDAPALRRPHDPPAVVAIASSGVCADAVLCRAADEALARRTSLLALVVEERGVAGADPSIGVAARIARWHPGVEVTSRTVGLDDRATTEHLLSGTGPGSLVVVGPGAAEELVLAATAASDEAARALARCDVLSVPGPPAYRPPGVGARVVAACDVGPSGPAVLRAGRREARRARSSLEVITVVPDDEPEARRRLARLERLVDDDGPPVRIRVRTGSVLAHLVEASANADLVVVGHGRMPSPAAGPSLATVLRRTSPVPVLEVAAHTGGRTRVGGRGREALAGQTSCRLVSSRG
jgi:hypothetical protein